MLYQFQIETENDLPEMELSSTWTTLEVTWICSLNQYLVEIQHQFIILFLARGSIIHDLMVVHDAIGYLNPIQTLLKWPCTMDLSFDSLSILDHSSTFFVTSLQTILDYSSISFTNSSTDGYQQNDLFLGFLCTMKTFSRTITLYLEGSWFTIVFLWLVMYTMFTMAFVRLLMGLFAVVTFEEVASVN